MSSAQSISPAPAYDPERPSALWREPLGPIEGAADVGVLVFAGYGLNCEAETAAGFEMLGARPRIRHFSDVIDDATPFGDTRIVVFGGGFSFGDHIASGRVFANRVRARLGDRLARFVDDGGLVLGICNGFQTIAKLGLVPGLERRQGDPLATQQATVVHNDKLGYRNQWVRLRIDPQSPCVFTQGVKEGAGLLEVPSRHGEGKVLLSEAFESAVLEGHLVPVRYADANGDATEAWPDNPNGSPGGIAACVTPRAGCSDSCRTPRPTSTRRIIRTGSRSVMPAVCPLTVPAWGSSRAASEPRFRPQAPERQDSSVHERRCTNVREYRA